MKKDQNDQKYQKILNLEVYALTKEGFPTQDKEIYLDQIVADKVSKIELQSNENETFGVSQGTKMKEKRENIDDVREYKEDNRPQERRENSNANKIDEAEWGVKRLGNLMEQVEEYMREAEPGANGGPRSTDQSKSNNLKESKRGVDSGNLLRVRL